MDLQSHRMLVLGAGEMATGAVRALHLAGVRRIVCCELPAPRTIRRGVALAQAVFAGACEVEGLRGRLVADLGGAERAWDEGFIPVIVDPSGDRVLAAGFRPDVLVDARMAKRNLGTRLELAPLVVGLGPGFRAGKDVHAVVETARGHELGRVIRDGAAQDNTGIPGPIEGETERRVVRAPAAGPWRGSALIGDRVEAGVAVGWVAGQPAVTRLAGVVRGVLADGIDVHEGFKAADIDPRGRREACFTVSDKARLVGAGVLEAILARL